MIYLAKKIQMSIFCACQAKPLEKSHLFKQLSFLLASFSEQK